MNKDELQIGDLVMCDLGWISSIGVGLVIDDHLVSSWDAPRYRVLWLGTDQVLRHSRKSLIKLEIPNEPK